MIVLPLLITIWLLSFLFNIINANVTPVVLTILKASGTPGLELWPARILVPLIGLILTAASIYLIGLLAGNLAGRRILLMVEAGILRIPLVKGVYGAARQLLDAFSMTGTRAFSQVVLVQYPRRGLWTVGFVTTDREFDMGSDGSGRKSVAVFLPTTPNPTSGWMILVEPDELLILDMSIEEAVKLIVSGGIVGPENFGARIRPWREPATSSPPPSRSPAMNAALIAVGTELLDLGRRDTNSDWLTERLLERGVRVTTRVAVGDDVERIADHIRCALGRADLVIVSGGLGPTGDDRTREAVAVALDLPLERDPSMAERLATRFRSHGRKFGEHQRGQADRPSGARWMLNPVGIAPGFVIESQGASIVALPGVPSELRAMFEQGLTPMLPRGTEAQRRVLKVAGRTESWVDERIRDLYDLGGARVTILARPGGIEIALQLTGGSAPDAPSRLEQLERTVSERLGDDVFGRDHDTLASVTGELLVRAGRTVATAESCTAGLLAGAITEVPGSSAWFRGGVVTYSDDLKTSLAGVSQASLVEHGAVSGQSFGCQLHGSLRRRHVKPGLAHRRARLDELGLHPGDLELQLAGVHGEQLGALLDGSPRPPAVVDRHQDPAHLGSDAGLARGQEGSVAVHRQGRGTEGQQPGGHGHGSQLAGGGRRGLGGTLHHPVITEGPHDQEGNGEDQADKGPGHAGPLVRGSVDGDDWTDSRAGAFRVSRM